jgi:hypothetical protein
MWQMKWHSITMKIVMTNEMEKRFLQMEVFDHFLEYIDAEDSEFCCSIQIVGITAIFSPETLISLLVDGDRDLRGSDILI